MAVIEVGIVLVAKPNPSCIVTLNDLTAPDSGPLWRKLPGGSLRLDCEYGVWDYYGYPKNLLLLLNPSGTSAAVFLDGVPPDFLSRVHVQSLTGSGILQGPNGPAITWTMKQLYDKAP